VRLEMDVVDYVMPGYTLDLEAYSRRYEGLTKAARLRLIANKYPAVKYEALRLLVVHIKKGYNTMLYNDIIAMAGDLLVTDEDKDIFTYDNSWVTEREQLARERAAKLEHDLHVAKSTLVKESIRLALNDIGYLNIERGLLNDALKVFYKTQEHCTVSRHIAEMCVNIITTLVDLNELKQAQSQLAKLESYDVDKLTRAKVKAISGLVALRESNYLVAARKFVDIDIEASGSFTSIMSPEDIAIYGVLAATASFDRSELNNALHNNASFKSILETVPDVKLFAHNFYNGRYIECFTWLKLIAPQLSLDIYLYSIVPELLRSIKDQLFIRYFTPYKTVDMRKMAAKMELTLENVEEIVAKLISRQLLPARIDSETKTVHRNEQDDRRVAIEKILEVAAKHGQDIRNSLLNLSVLQHGLAVVSKESVRRGASRGDPDMEFYNDSMSHYSRSSAD